ncbi:unnamed protein product [Prunus armeniaca]
MPGQHSSPSRPVSNSTLPSSILYVPIPSSIVGVIYLLSFLSHLSLSFSLFTPTTVAAAVSLPNSKLEVTDIKFRGQSLPLYLFLAASDVADAK